MSGTKIFHGKGIVPGRCVGPALVCRQPLPLRGFADLEKGVFQGGMGELEGVSFAGVVLIFPSSKGSTMWSMTLDMACRFGHVPAAMINTKLDPFVVLSCVLEEIPLVQVSGNDIFGEVRTGDRVTVDGDRGEITLHRG